MPPENAIGEISGWSRERCTLERVRTRTELAFIRGDRAHGGPTREPEMTALRERLAALETHLRGLDG